MQFTIPRRLTLPPIVVEIDDRYESASAAAQLGAAVKYAVLTRTNLTGAVLRGAYLTDADLTGAVLTRTNLTGALLTRADLTDADLTDADLTGADLTGAVLTRTNLTGAVLRGAYLTDADLTGAVLTRTNLTGAVLRGAYLTDADLTGAVLTRTNLTGVLLTRADLTDADLTDADLTGADLTGAVLTGAVLTDIPIVPNIDAAIYAAITDGRGELQMGVWHTCQTTHCRAGWAIVLAGAPGAALEAKVGSAAAGALIYAKSRPGIPIPGFYVSNEAALADIQARAAEQSGSEAPQ